MIKPAALLTSTTTTTQIMLRRGRSLLPQSWIIPETLFGASPSHHGRYRVSSCSFSSFPLPSRTNYCAMKPGTPIPGLDFYKDRDPPVALPRDEYPSWVSQLAHKDLSLAQLRRMPFEQASDAQQKRYIKLTRRMKIKQRNEESTIK